MSNKPTILLVEDESSTVFVIKKYFAEEGYNVLTAFSAQDAIKIALEDHPDVIILDIMMPASSGLDILPELRSDPWGKTAKVIVFSNLSGDEYKATANKYNTDRYLIKTDTSLKDLESVVKEILPKNDYSSDRD